ncbi:uncharacterized protein [Montipora capricornis]|uniref:uncharacterized protein isoform X4 n=1 Tax=Montipora capricornis TaxID=246305 RepID=UPI0035F16FB5
MFSPFALKMLGNTNFLAFGLETGCFKNITVSRVKKDRACYISPLPPDLPRPNVLSKGLKKVSKLPPNHNISTTRQQWIVAGTVDKRTLRKEVQDFCGQFSIYRLKPYVPYSVSVVASDEGQSHADRIRRSGTGEFPLCTNRIPSVIQIRGCTAARLPPLAVCIMCHANWMRETPFLAV